MRLRELTKFNAIFVPLFLSSLNCVARTIPLQGAPGPIVAGHLNGDGKVDLVVGDQSNESLVVLLGSGDGQFVEAEDSPFTLAASPEDLELADMNGDGLLDVAIANHEAPLLSVMLGNGQGKFSASTHSPIRVNSRPHPHGIAVGDFNQDGIMDLATESWEDDELIVIYGNDTGYASKPHARLKVGDFPYFKLRSSHLNGDGRPDLIATNWGGSCVSVLLSNQQGGFNASNFIPTAPSPFAVAVGHLNGDDQQDLVVAHRVGSARDNSADGLSVLLGDGSGDFEALADPLPEVGNSPTSVAIGDFNGDGPKDIAVANYASNDVTILLGEERGFKHANGSPFKVGQAPVTVLLEDLNNDGMDDIVASNSEGRSLSVVLSVY